MSVAMWIIWLFCMGSHYIHSSINQWSAVHDSFKWGEDIAQRRFICQIWNHFGFDPCFTKAFSMKDQWTFSHLSYWKPHKCELKPSEHGSFFQDNQFEGSHAYVYSKIECFPIYLLGNPINVCWNPQNRTHFSETINLRGHMPRFTLKMNISTINLLGNPINVWWNPQNMACFSEMINLRGHMPRFTLKMNIFPSISLETP